jgi:hypothetical protein
VEDLLIMEEQEELVELEVVDLEHLVVDKEQQEMQILEEVVEDLKEIQLQTEEQAVQESLL